MRLYGLPLGLAAVSATWILASYFAVGVGRIVCGRVLAYFLVAVQTSKGHVYPRSTVTLPDRVVPHLPKLPVKVCQLRIMAQVSSQTSWAHNPKSALSRPYCLERAVATLG
jgi:hypothetical protein